MNAESEKFDHYVNLLLNVHRETMTKQQMADEVGVSVQTIYAWAKRVDWDWIKTERRKRYASRIIEIDSAMFLAATEDKDVRAAELMYQRFDGWVPASAQVVVHDINDAEVDEELKRLMQQKKDLVNVIANTVDDGARAQTEGVDSAQAVPSAA